jgi:hypothetical protein
METGVFHIEYTNLLFSCGSDQLFEKLHFIRGMSCLGEHRSVSEFFKFHAFDKAYDAHNFN